jgi:tRNA nucleotidyltransferase/poly(A) polymerase
MVMMEDLNKCGEIYFQDPYNHIVFDSVKDGELFMVGGFVRDILLGRKGFDRDYVVRDDFQGVAARVAIKTGGKLVQIGKRNLFRVLTKNGTSMDFTQMNQDINYDLSGRDFTINALAWSPETGLIDLFNGIEDIEKGLIRSIKRENLINDPARIVRAYRLLGELSFEIEESTRRMLKEIALKIREVKTERITLEFFKILNISDPFIPLRALHEDAIMTQLICMPNNKFQLKLHALNELNKIVKQKAFKNFLELEKSFSQGLSYIGLLRLEVLLAEAQGSLLTLSSKIRKRISSIEKAITLMPEKEAAVKEKLYLVFDTAGEAAIDFLVINNMLKFLPDLRIFQKIERKGLLSAHEIMDILRIDEGVILGRAKEFIKKGEFCRKIKTKSGAIELLRSNADILGI